MKYCKERTFRKQCNISKCVYLLDFLLISLTLTFSVFDDHYVCYCNEEETVVWVKAMHTMLGLQLHIICSLTSLQIEMGSKTK